MIPPAVRYAIIKAGVVPSACRYDIKVKNKQGRPDVEGWGPCSFRSTEGFNRYAVRFDRRSIGISAHPAYWSHLMLSPNEAFRKFRSNLELTQGAGRRSRRPKEIRALMDESFKIADGLFSPVHIAAGPR